MHETVCGKCEGAGGSWNWDGTWDPCDECMDEESQEGGDFFDREEER